MNHSTADENTLLSCIAQGDRAAFEALYDRCAGHAMGLAMRMLRDRAASEDVLQEAFWRVWQHASKFDPALGNARSWLLTIVHRLAIDAQRRHIAQPIVEIDAHETEWEIEDQDADVSAHAFNNISSQQVRMAIAGLPEKQRSVIELAFFHGKTHREIAELLGEPLGTVHSRALQGMAALKQALWHQE
jgi:RNA polymerase sigma-70 factor (ECF subfamily)